MNTLFALTMAVGVVGLAMTPGPFDSLTDALTTDFVPPMLAAIGVVVTIALGIVLVKWGIPQLIGFFKRTAK